MKLLYGVIVPKPIGYIIDHSDHIRSSFVFVYDMKNYSGIYYYIIDTRNNNFIINVELNDEVKYFGI